MKYLINICLNAFFSIKTQVNRHPWRAALLAGTLVFWLFSLPRPLFTASYSAVAEDRDGALLGARIADDGQWRFPVGDSLPEKYVQCLVAFEDRMFWYHPGVNPASFVRALRQNIKEGRTVSGGSTITMQVIRMASGNPPRTLLHKIWEIFRATRLELTYSKRHILRLYAAHAPYGGNVVGLEAASWRYFGKKAQELSWAEAALLAVLPNSPALLHPGRGQEMLLAKRNRLLQRLLDSGVLDARECELSQSEPLPPNPHPLPRRAPHLLDKLEAQRSPSAPQAIWHTTLKKEFQVRVSEIVERRHEVYKGNEIHNMAAIVLDVETGEVLAYVGNAPGAGKEHGEDVDIITAPRSTGSILKPWLLAYSLEGGDILPNMLLEDVPVQFGDYKPENYRETYDGAVPAHLALVRSLNVPFVHLLQQHGLEKFHFELRKLGLTTINRPPAHYGLSLILGGAEANLLEITNVYACMARRLGQFYARNGKISSSDFRPPSFLHHRPPASSLTHTLQAGELSPGAIWHTFMAMQEVERPNSSGEWEMFRSGKHIAWKTGTSFGFRDAWAVGVNARYAVGVWVGNADGEGRPGLIGVDMAAPVLFEIFHQLPGGDDWFDPPYDNMTQLSVCRLSGCRANEFCPADTLWLPLNAVNAVSCPYHQLIHLDAAGQWQVNSDCCPPSEMQHRPWFIMDPLYEHFYRSKHPEYAPPPPFRADCATALAEASSSPLRLIYPRAEAQVYIPVELDGRLGSVVFHAAHRNPDTEIYWHLDGVYLGATRTFHQMALQPAVGEHHITLVDKAGNRMERRFVVLGK